MYGRLLKADDWFMDIVEHVPGGKPLAKMDTPVGLWRGTCSCGWQGNDISGSEKQATKSAKQHSDAKNKES